MAQYDTVCQYVINMPSPCNSIINIGFLYSDYLMWIRKEFVSKVLREEMMKLNNSNSRIRMEKIDIKEWLNSVGRLL